jgi:hypothetical protein
MRLRLAPLASILVYAGVCAAQSTPAIFEFHSGFWINLHQFLIHQRAAAEAAPSDPPEWRDVVSYYRRVMAQQDLTSRAGEAMNNRMAEAGSDAELRPDGAGPGIASRSVESRARLPFPLVAGAQSVQSGLDR